MSRTYPNHNLPVAVHGHIGMKRAIEKMTPLVDAIPPYTEDNIGGVLTVVGGSAAAEAEGTVTFASTGPANGDTLVIGGVTYTFVTALSTGPTVPNEIVRSDTPATAATRLAEAINDGAGTNVSVGTVAHSEVSAEAAAAVVTITALATGPDGNSIGMDVSDAANTTASGATLAGGADETQFGLAWV